MLMLILISDWLAMVALLVLLVALLGYLFLWAPGHYPRSAFDPMRTLSLALRRSENGRLLVPHTREAG